MRLECCVVPVPTRRSKTRNVWYAVGIGSAAALRGEVLWPTVNAVDVDPWPVELKWHATSPPGAT